MNVDSDPLRSEITLLEVSPPLILPIDSSFTNAAVMATFSDTNNPLSSQTKPLHNYQAVDSDTNPTPTGVHGGGESFATQRKVRPILLIRPCIVNIESRLGRTL